VNSRTRKRPSSPKPRVSREERKQRTREAIIDAALRLLAEDSFSGLSLREVTREAGIVPGAFYRHFDSMESLGLVLIDESFRSLRDMLRTARGGELDPDHIIESSIDVLAHNVAAHRLQWRFIGRERNSGVSVLRYAIRAEIRLITSELATDLARFPGLNRWTTEDLNVLAGLFVNSMIQIAEALEDTVDPATRDEIRRVAAKQLRMIVVGVAGWRSGAG
jgi:AcrR family transcriptional regulator